MGFAAASFVFGDELVQLKKELNGILGIGRTIGITNGSVEGELRVFERVRAVDFGGLVQLS